jgi:hypothetical protein
MASGVNSTFRQIGIATGVVVLGSLFTHRVTDALAGTPAAARSGTAVRAAFADALNEITLVAALVALAAAVLSVLLIRARDFHPAPEATVLLEGAAAR